MKLKTIYQCSNCTEIFTKWSGQCSGCNQWNTLVEDVIDADPKTSIKKDAPILKSVVSIDQILVKKKRIKTSISELDRVLGGGFMSDSLVLLAGNPGIGKSTLTLQLAEKISQLGKKVYYFSGEESSDQIMDRFNRLGLKSSLHLFNAFHLESILSTIKSDQPDFIIIDSIQVISSENSNGQAGSISQVRYVAEQLMHLAKSKNIPVLLIGHVNKAGHLAGPQVLTHLVDTVLFLEGDNFQQFRMLRSTKNRFGAIDEVGVFQMAEKGLQEVKNPSELFLEGRAESPMGSVIFPALEGTRTFLIEIQALTSSTNFGYPKRTASGIDLNRLNIILAVLERFGKIKLDSSDVFVNVVGGFKIKDPAADLAIAMAIASSKLKKPLPEKLAVIGELGLSGEVRRVSQLDKRIKEVEKLGFEQMIIPKSKIGKSGLDFAQVKTLVEVLRDL